MKYFYCLLFYIILSTAQRLSSQTEITPFITITVILKDSTLTTGGEDLYYSLYDRAEKAENSTHFLSPDNFLAFQLVMDQMIKSPAAKAYMPSDLYTLSPEELRKCLIQCDTAVCISYNDNGEEIVCYTVSCDSIGRLFYFEKIDLFQSWHFNTENNMIECEVLGYRVWELNKYTGKYKALFCLFRDEKTMEKVRKHLHY